LDTLALQSFVSLDGFVKDLVSEIAPLETIILTITLARNPMLIEVVLFDQQLTYNIFLG